MRQMALIMRIYIIVAAVTSCKQAKFNYYDPKDYKLARKGPDSWEYVMTYTNMDDTNYSLKKVYLDSNYSELLQESFYYRNLLDGPSKTYAAGKLFIRNSFKNGKDDGERLTYNDDGSMRSKAFFKNGLKTGVWEWYDKSKVKKRVEYDDKGAQVLEISYR